MWDKILRFRVHYQNMSSFISHGSKNHMWSTCLFELRTMAVMKDEDNLLLKLLSSYVHPLSFGIERPE